MPDTATLEEDSSGSAASWPRLPPAPRHPMRALDERAMDLASSDASCARRSSASSTSPRLPQPRRPRPSPHGFLDRGRGPPAPLAAAMRMANTGRAAWPSAPPSAAGVRHMAHRFIVGESPEALRRAARAVERGRGATVDLLGEATVTSAEADRYAARCADALRRARRRRATWPSRPDARAGLRRPVPRVNLSVKVSALTPLLRPEAPERGSATRPRLRPLLREAREGRGPPARRHGVGRLARGDARARARAARRAGVRRGPSAGIVLQAYLRDSPPSSTASSSGRRAAPRAAALVRLVKGAYWDHEVSRRASTAGRRRCSRTRPTATATSRRSPAACSTRARPCASRSPPTTCAPCRTPSPTTA